MSTVNIRKKISMNCWASIPIIVGLNLTCRMFMFWGMIPRVLKCNRLIIFWFRYQEAPIPPSDLVLDSTWVHSMKCLLAKYSYVMIKHIRIQGILSCVFIRRSLLTFLRNVEVNYTRTGFGGLWGNKGGVSIRMTINGYNICFVNCHLAAHDNKIERRIQDYHDIIYTQNFKHLKTPKILNHEYVILFALFQSLFSSFLLLPS